MKDIPMNYIPSLDNLYNKVCEYVTENQSKKGYIATQDKEVDTIYGIVYDDFLRSGVEVRIVGVKCVDGILMVCYEPISEVDVVYSDADYENAHWEEVRYSDLVFYDATLLKIAEFIHEYVED